MKALSPSEMFRLVNAVDERTMDLAAERLLPMFPMGTDVKRLKYGVTEGHFNCTGVQIDGRVAYVIWWHRTIDNGLAINAAASTDPAQPDRFDCLMEAVEKIARTTCCDFVSFMTCRAGLAEKTSAWGYAPVSVLFRKKL